MFSLVQVWPIHSQKRTVLLLPSLARKSKTHILPFKFKDVFPSALNLLGFCQTAIEQGIFNQSWGTNFLEKSFHRACSNKSLQKWQPLPAMLIGNKILMCIFTVVIQQSRSTMVTLILKPVTPIRSERQGDDLWS